MKKIIFVLILLLNATPAYAEQGGWVKVDANGKIISGTIVCSPDVCGDLESPYAKATLLPGERYVQITKADPVTNNVTGPNVVAQAATATPNQTVTATVNPVTNEATVTTTTVIPLAPKVTAVKEEITTFSTQQANPVTTVKTPVIQVEDPETVTQDPEFIDWLALINQMFQFLFVNFTWAWDL
jgi:hypothetical protein